MRTLGVFVSLVLALATALVYLTWKTIENERVIAQQQATTQLDNAIDRVGAELRSEIASIEALMGLDAAQGPRIPDHVVVVRARAEQIESRPADRLPFVPGSGMTGDPTSDFFVETEALEHSASNSGAADKYRALAIDARPDIRAGALMRLGRVLRHNRQYAQALDVYGELMKLDAVPVEAWPSVAAALLGRMAVFEATKQSEALQREAAKLAGVLWSGRYNFTRASWEFLKGEVLAANPQSWPAIERPDRLALADATAWVHQQWLADRNTTGRRSIVVNDQPVLAMWRGSADRLDLVVAGSAFVQKLWTMATAGKRVEGGLVSEGRVVAGTMAASDLTGQRTEAVAGLPWTIYLTATEDPATAALFADQRQMYVVGLAVLLMTLLAGSYFIVRSINRERAVGRLQSEFVSAVSHEFRTPLTSMRQLSEMLANERVTADADRQHIYGVLQQESERLQHLVESLLDFGRAQHGAATYQFETVDAAGLVDDVVRGFRTIAASRGFDVKHERSDSSVAVVADRDALSLALRNLLDNAVKYSVQCKTIWVDALIEPRTVGIRVRDQGIGIPPAEQRSIFDKFVRGAASKEAGIKGTGIGLALAHQIVRAHRGEIRLDSEPGRGSTFTIVLPLADA